MMVRPAEEEVDVEVRREDQDNINKFARLNARLQELREERNLIKVSFFWQPTFMKIRNVSLYSYHLTSPQMHYHVLLTQLQHNTT